MTFYPPTIDDVCRWALRSPRPYAALGRASRWTLAMAYLHPAVAILTDWRQLVTEIDGALALFAVMSSQAGDAKLHALLRQDDSFFVHLGLELIEGSDGR